MEDKPKTHIDPGPKQAPSARSTNRTAEVECGASGAETDDSSDTPVVHKSSSQPPTTILKITSWENMNSVGRLKQTTPIPPSLIERLKSIDFGGENIDMSCLTAPVTVAAEPDDDPAEYSLGNLRSLTSPYILDRMFTHLGQGTTFDSESESSEESSSDSSGSQLTLPDPVGPLSTAPKVISTPYFSRGARGYRASQARHNKHNVAMISPPTIAVKAANSIISRDKRRRTAELSSSCGPKFQPSNRNMPPNGVYRVHNSRNGIHRPQTRAIGSRTLYDNSGSASRGKHNWDAGSNTSYAGSSDPRKRARPASAAISNIFREMDAEGANKSMNHLPSCFTLPGGSRPQLGRSASASTTSQQRGFDFTRSRSTLALRGNRQGSAGWVRTPTNIHRNTARDNYGSHSHGGNNFGGSCDRRLQRPATAQVKPKTKGVCNSGPRSALDFVRGDMDIIEREAELKRDRRDKKRMNAYRDFFKEQLYEMVLTFMCSFFLFSSSLV